MKKIIFYFVLSLFIAVAPFSAGAAPYQYDLGVRQSGIFFSKSRLIANDDIRIYARIKNYGSEDVSAHVTFYKSNELIGDSQVVTVRAGGLDDEVYVDFTVPSGSFNIRAEIRGQDPGDENPANDVALTTLFFPELDNDGDGVPNDDDNCLDVANSDQADADADGIGDACDSDDDNDGWEDSREHEEGTDPTDPDTDNDGVNDPGDDYPLDPSRQETPPVIPESTDEVIPPAEPGQQQPSSTEPAEADREDQADETVSSAQEDGSEEDGDIEEDTEEGEVSIEEGTGLSDLKISPRASFSYKRLTWNQYEFQALGALRKNYRYEWDFGDGETSTQEKVVHTFDKSGDYIVTLKVIDLTGNIAQDEVRVSISFFNFENWKLKALLGGILAGTVIVLIVLGRMSQKKLMEDKK